MIAWFRGKRSGCRAVRGHVDGLLESAGAPGAEASESPADPDLRAHLAACPGCRRALEDAFAARHMLRGQIPPAIDPGPEFTAAVMRAIAAQNSEGLSGSSTWFAIPALAARVAWVSAVVLLLVTTWLYQRRPPMTDQPAAADSAASSLEPAPQPASQDEVLASLAGREP